MLLLSCFFFQAEDGIRDSSVTGVQTCALPIWKEFELELMRDQKDNVVVVCSIENIDPMGVHTGDSVTVAPAMTLTDREYQNMRDTAIAIMRARRVDTDGSNTPFAPQPPTPPLPL